MEIQYKRTPHVSHMIIECETPLPRHVFRMLTSNNIPGILSGAENKNGDRIRYWFDVTGKKSLRGYFMREGINPKSIGDLLNALSKAIGSAEKYLVETNSVIIGPDTVFVQKTSELQVFLACVQQSAEDYMKGIVSVFDYLIQNVDHEDEASAKVCYELYELAVSGEENLKEYSLLCQRSEEFLSPPDTDYEKEPERLPKKEPVFEPVVLPEIKLKENKKEKKKEKKARIKAKKKEEKLFYDDIWDTGIQKEKKDLKSILDSILDKGEFKIPKPAFLERIKNARDSGKEYMDFDDYIVNPLPYEPKEDNPVRYNFEKEITGKEKSEKGNLTGVLEKPEESNRCLLYLGRGPHRDGVITGTTFRIGSRLRDNDMVIEDDVISRFHAVITREGEDFYLEDLESKNGTYVNGKILNFRSKVKLREGDRISFANIGYRFE